MRRPADFTQHPQDPQYFRVVVFRIVGVSLQPIQGMAGRTDYLIQILSPPVDKESKTVVLFLDINYDDDVL